MSEVPPSLWASHPCHSPGLTVEAPSGPPCPPRAAGEYLPPCLQGPGFDSQPQANGVRTPGAPAPPLWLLFPQNQSSCHCVCGKWGGAGSRRLAGHLLPGGVAAQWGSERGWWALVGCLPQHAQWTPDPSSNPFPAGQTSTSQAEEWIGGTPGVQPRPSTGRPGWREVGEG